MQGVELRRQLPGGLIGHIEAGQIVRIGEGRVGQRPQHGRAHFRRHLGQQFIGHAEAAVLGDLRPQTDVDPGIRAAEDVFMRPKIEPRRRHQPHGQHHPFPTGQSILGRGDFARRIPHPGPAPSPQGQEPDRHDQRDRARAGSLKTPNSARTSASQPVTMNAQRQPGKESAGSSGAARDEQPAASRTPVIEPGRAAATEDQPGNHSATPTQICQMKST